MDLLKYLEPMKNLPERFSNLAFWRGFRNLKDCVVNAFEYLDSWGKSIETGGTQIIRDIVDLNVKVGAIAKYKGYSSYGMSNPIDGFASLLTIESIGQYADGVKIKPNHTNLTAIVPSNCDSSRISKFIPVLFCRGRVPPVIVDLTTLLDVEIESVDTSGVIYLMVSPSAAARNLNYHVPLVKGVFTSSSSTVTFSILILYKA